MMAQQTRKRTHLTQAAEPPMWMIDPPGEGGLENPVDPPGAEAPPMLADSWDDELGGEG
ncbi:MAG TPA: hypothetical protein VD969_21760 [Symbiobacteriaceae bacterium]|nr:hypothetical protein [Symbiobacteriaceae bacterium]